METTVYQSNISISYKSLDLLISSILNNNNNNNNNNMDQYVGLGVTCSSRDPRFAGSKPAEVDGFFQDVKILSKSPSGGTLSWGSRA